MNTAAKTWQPEQTAEGNAAGGGQKTMPDTQVKEGAGQEATREFASPRSPDGESVVTVIRETPEPVNTATELKTFVPPATFGDYELLQEIARGGMGVVYRARQQSLERMVALKMILPAQMSTASAIERFYREARAAAALDHPNIVPIYEIGQREGQHYYTMAFIQGQSLKALCKNNPLPADEAVALLRSVADAVEYAHARGIVHRDLKPDNVLLDMQARPRVTDFGLAKKIEGDAGLTGKGQILGTPAYMAPEQALGRDSLIGPSCDIYALGGILYFLLTGKAPFSGANITEILCQVATQPPLAPSCHNQNIPPALEAVVLRCLQKDISQRPGTVQELLHLLADPNLLRREPSLRTAASSFSAPGSPPELIPSRPDLANNSSLKSTASALPSFAPAASASSAHARTKRSLVPCAAGLLLLGVVTAGAAYFLNPGETKAPKEDKNGPSKGIQPASPTFAMPKNIRQDFGLAVRLIGGHTGSGGVQEIFEGTQVAFELETESDAYVRLWTIDPRGNVVLLFPNTHEPDNFLRAKQRRRIPGKDYTLRAELTGSGPETLRLEAASKRLDVVRGQSVGELYQGFTLPEAEVIWATTRGISIQTPLAEHYIRYLVVPRK